MNILITGGHGFIGHNVVRELSSRGAICTVIDNHADYDIIPSDEIDYLMSGRQARIGPAGYYDINVCSADDVYRAFCESAPDIVVHLASFPRQKVVNARPREASDIMMTGLINLLDRARKHSVQKFVYVSSSMVYGNFDDQVKENAECRPLGTYGILKLAGEMLVRDYSRSYGFAHTILRPSAVYGPWDVEDRVISKFLLAAMRGTTLQVRGADDRLDFTHVDDVARGIAQAVMSERTCNRTYNITRSRGWSLLEAANLAIRTAGRGSLWCVGRDQTFPSRGTLDIGAAQQDFGFSPVIDLEEGIQSYYEWLQDSAFWTERLKKTSISI